MAIIFIFILALILVCSIVYIRESKKQKKIKENMSKNKKENIDNGECYVNYELSKIKGEMINNFIIKDDFNNKTHQINQIFICKKGIFVIKTRNYSGKIYGNDTQTKWTQVLSSGKTNNEFHSPVRQNENHIDLLKNILGENESYNNIVVFVKNNTKNIDSKFTYPLKKLRKHIVEMQDVYTEEQIKEIKDKLYAYQVSQLNNENNKKAKNNNTDDNICPVCGAPLVLKKSKHGMFYGCSNYPKCTFIKQIRSENNNK